MAYTHLAYFDQYTDDLERLTNMIQKQMSRGPTTADKDQVVRLVSQMDKLGTLLSKIPLYRK